MKPPTKTLLLLLINVFLSAVTHSSSISNSVDKVKTCVTTSQAHLLEMKTVVLAGKFDF